MNSLTKVDKENREKHFRSLLYKYPKVREVILLLIAERLKNGKIDIFDPYYIEDIISIEFKNKNINEIEINKIVNFCKNTGILNLFQEINKDIYDYLIGIEVGLDSNARKNRSGNIFEIMCQQKISQIISNAYKIVKNDSKFSLYPVIFKEKSKGKTHDLVLYKNETPVAIIECNFYNVPESKPISIAESYVEMNKVAHKHNIIFIWITDGPAWKSMKEPLVRAMKEIDWVLNYRMIDLIKKILLKN